MKRGIEIDPATRRNLIRMSEEVGPPTQRLTYLLHQTDINSPEANAYFDLVKYTRDCVAIGQDEKRLKAREKDEVMKMTLKEKLSKRYEDATLVLGMYMAQMFVLYELQGSPNIDPQTLVLNDFINVAYSVYGEEAVKSKLK